MKNDMFSVVGKTALVTGASRGIGEEIARVLAAYGAHVVVSSRKLDGCRAVAESIEEDGGSADAFACNVGSMEDIGRTFEFVGEKFGGLDILVNNAATNPYYGPILDTPPEAFQKTIDVNVRGFFYMSVGAAKLMRDSNGGAIVNTGSVVGLQPFPGQGAYAVSKAAVINMTRAFAAECGAYNVRVNALIPGLTKTSFASALFEDDSLYEQAVRNIPLKRHATPSEMAGTVLLLVSDAGGYITGECVVVDGGMTSTRI